MLFQHGVDLAPYTTFRVPAKASVLTAVGSAAQLDRLAATPGFENRDWHILGGGSNILLTQDLVKPVVRISVPGLRLLSESGDQVLIEAGAGVVWHKLVNWSLDQGLSGLENLSLIPGTVGAAPIQNIGAYGVELKDLFHSLDAWEVATGTVRTFDRADCDFGYRESAFKRDIGRWVVLQVRLTLSRTPRLNLDYGAIREVLAEKGIASPTPKDVSDAVIAIRRSKLPDPAMIGNAGSFFKNPEIQQKQYDGLKAAYPELPGWPTNDGMVKIPAGWLIERAGWKGFREGDAGVHDRQALVLVNHGAATGAQLRDLAGRIIHDIRQRYGVALVPEVWIW